MDGILDGIRVLDFSHVLAGPICTNHLRLQGADVIKIESADGDTMRHYGGESHPDGLSPSFIAVNAGKRSVVLDLKRADHVEVVHRLIRRSDVLVENFRPGVMARLGFGPAACRGLRPDLIFCSISGFGQQGPLRSNPAIDQIIQSMSGLMTLSGEPGSGPMRVGFPLVDTYTGLTAAYAIVLALLRRERTGHGQVIDAAMLDAAFAMMVSVAGPFLAAGVRPAKTGNLGYSKSPTADTFPTARGDLTLGVVRQQQFEALSREVGRPQWLADPRVATRAARQRHGPQLREAVIDALAADDAIAWEARLTAAGLAAGAVRELPEALAMPHVQGRGLVRPIPLRAGRTGGPADGPVRGLNAGFAVDEASGGIDAGPPRLGEHTRDVLAELGYDAHEIAALVRPSPGPAD